MPIRNYHNYYGIGGVDGDLIASDTEAETALLTLDNDAYNLNQQKPTMSTNEYEANSVESSYEDLSGGQDDIYDYIK